MGTGYHVAAYKTILPPVQPDNGPWKTPETAIVCCAAREVGQLVQTEGQQVGDGLGVRAVHHPAQAPLLPPGRRHVGCHRLLDHRPHPRSQQVPLIQRPSHFQPADIQALLSGSKKATLDGGHTICGS